MDGSLPLLSRQAADKPGRAEEDTRPEGRELVEMKGGRPGPRRHICHCYSPGACGAWEPCLSPRNPPPKKTHTYTLTSPSTGLGLGKIKEILGESTESRYLSKARHTDHPQ